ncbi:hypothetical protein METBIDRAFT_14494, partial [Metschnikowia bicuspidata var. bicuspidata NRRL YB-4993]
MDKDSQIKMLQEMGFLNNQAMEALSASGNDLNKAIAYLFGEVDASSGAGTQLAPYDVESEQIGIADSVGISNPHDIPEFLTLFVNEEGNMAEAMKENQGPFYSSNSASSSSSSSLEEVEDDSLLEEPEEEYPENVKTEFTNVPFLLSKRNKARSWVPLILILTHSSIFAGPVLQLRSKLSFIRELQQIVYFVQNFDNSKRWYHDTDKLAKILENDGPCGSLQDEELILNIIDFLMRKEPALKPIFESMVQSLDEDISNNLTVLEIDSDSRGSTLYETLNELFWQKDFEFLGRIKYSSVAPIVTYQLLAADSNTSHVPFQLLEIMYPEIYSDKALGRVREEIHLIKRAQMEYQKLNRKLMDLNFFEGKKIDGLLLQTASALQENNPNASEDLRELANLLQELRFAELENQAQAKSNASPQRLALLESIICDLPDLRAYNLVGVIFSETKYFVRAGENWVDMDGGVTIDYASVANAVERRIGSQNITLVYA